LIQVAQQGNVKMLDTSRIYVRREAHLVQLCC
jgi:hypothetical protein